MASGQVVATRRAQPCSGRKTQTATSRGWVPVGLRGALRKRQRKQGAKTRAPGGDGVLDALVTVARGHHDACDLVESHEHADRDHLVALSLAQGARDCRVRGSEDDGTMASRWWGRAGLPSPPIDHRSRIVQ